MAEHPQAPRPEQGERPAASAWATLPSALHEALLDPTLWRLTELVEDYLSLVRASNIEVTPQELGPLVTTWAAEAEAPAAACGVTIQLEGLAALAPWRWRCMPARCAGRC